MGTRVTENHRILADNNEEEELEKKRKIHETSECCKEQQLLEAAAFHLILLSNNPLQQSYDFNHKGYNDSDIGCTGNNGGFSMITEKKKKKKKKKNEDYGVLEGIGEHEDAKSGTSSSTSSSAETIDSEISSVSMEKNEVEDNKGINQRLEQHRLRSIVDIYHVTNRL